MAIDAEVVLRLNFLRPQVPSLARHPVEARCNHHLRLANVQPAMRGSWPSRAHVAMCRRSRRMRCEMDAGCSVQRRKQGQTLTTAHSFFLARCG